MTAQNPDLSAPAASLFTERAVAYRDKNGIDHRAVSLAVLVQRLVPAEVAGVLFTADPLSGRRGVAVIDASPGLGEAVVSGAVNPDHFELDAAGQVLSVRPGDKRVAILPAESGGTRRVERTAQPEPCLSLDEARALAALGRRVEAHYGHPQDIEFALGPGRAILLLQARPITTLFPLPRPAPLRPPRPGEDDLRVYFNASVAQGVFRPMTPMGISAWFHVVSGGLAAFGSPAADREAPPIATEAALRWFADATPLVRSDLGRWAVSYALERMEPRTAALLAPVFRDPRLAPVRTSRTWLARRMLRIALRTQLPLHLVQALLFPASARARAAAAADEALRLGEVAPDAGPTELLDAVERMLAGAIPRTFLRSAPVFGVGMLCLLAVRRLLAGMATRQEVDTVLRALPHNPTTEMDLRLFQLSRRLREDPEVAARLGAARHAAPDPRALAQEFLAGTLPPALQRSLAEFLDVYGARGVAEIDLGMPRWRDDPTHLLGSLMNYLALPATATPADGLPDPERQFQKGEAEAEAMVQELVRRAGQRGRLRGWAVRFLLSRVRGLCGVREAPKFYIVRVFGRARQHLQRIGAALTTAGRLTQPDGIFFLTPAEARQAVGGADLRELEQARRKTYARELSRRHLPRVLLSDGSEPRAAEDVTGGPAATLRGAPVSAGQVTGVARVVLDPEGAQLRPGEILVAPSTDPGWTPLFLTAGGLVMEMGGSMSHGAVVAREYGIPAVVGVAGATERIRTGDRIQVDGTQGLVALAPS